MFSGAVILGQKRVIHKCLLCGREFYEGEVEVFHDHAAKHARKDLDDIRALAPSHINKGKLFDPAERDRDLERHWRSVRRDMKREGRTEVRPNEMAERGD